jgi:hypothetical protein
MTQFTCKGVKQINNRISLNMTFTFTIRISRHFSSAREFQMGNIQKYWSQNVGQDFIVLDFFHGRKILKVDRRDEGDPQNRKKMFLLGGNRAGGKGVCGRLMSPAQETQSMREIRLLCGRLPRKGGVLTGMTTINNLFQEFTCLSITKWHTGTFILDSQDMHYNYIM